MSITDILKAKKPHLHKAEQMAVSIFEHPPAEQIEMMDQLKETLDKMYTLHLDNLKLDK